MYNQIVKLVSGEQIVISGSKAYLSRDSSRKLIAECQHRAIRILGVELFEVREGKLRPRIDCIADFSDSDLEQSIKSSQLFIDTEMKAEMVASFVIDYDS